MSGPNGPDFFDADAVKIRNAVASIEGYTGGTDRAGAAALLPYYRGYDELTDAQRAAVLERFPKRRTAR